MTRTFIQTKEFSKNWDRLGFKDKDLRQLELELLNNPDKYPVMKGTGGLRKMKRIIYHRQKEMKSKKLLKLLRQVYRRQSYERGI